MDAMTGQLEAKTVSSGDCPACGGLRARSFYRASGVPVNSSVLLESRDEALAFPTGEMDLCLCPDCGFVYNRAFESDAVEYSARYEQPQGFSGTFSAFSAALADELIDRYDLRGKRVLEIGCGNGDFLALLCDRGGNVGTGFDPAFAAQRSQVANSDGVTVVTDYFSEAYATGDADFVCCKMTLEHIPAVKSFVEMVRQAAAQRSDTVVFFQVPDLSLILDEREFWDIYYEHCSYFTPESLARLFALTGFTVRRVWTGYGDQYLMIEAVSSGAPVKPEEDSLALDTLVTKVDAFARQVPDTIERWKKEIRKLAAAEKKVVLWGSGSKAVSFLTTIGIAGELRYVVDINPHRQGMFMPGTGHEIVAPESLVDYQPDVVIIMNPIYRDEISRELQSMGVRSDLRTVLDAGV